jgi:hypothetical protein
MSDGGRAGGFYNEAGSEHHRMRRVEITDG